MTSVLFWADCLRDSLRQKGTGGFCSAKALTCASRYERCWSVRRSLVRIARGLLTDQEAIELRDELEMTEPLRKQCLVYPIMDFLDQSLHYTQCLDLHWSMTVLSISSISSFLSSRHQLPRILASQIERHSRELSWKAS